MMTFPDTVYTAQMNPQQRAWFHAEYQRASKEEIVGFLLAFFLGGFGVHKFYLRRNTAGVWYLLFFWTGFPAILGFIDSFFMPRNVRAYNAAQAAFIANQILATPSPESATPPPPDSNSVFIKPVRAIPTTLHCDACGRSIDPAATFCPYCGEAKATTA